MTIGDLFSAIRAMAASGERPTIASVAALWGVPRRDVESLVEAARAAALPILTSGTGLGIATRSEQLLDQYRRNRRRAIHQLTNNRGSLRAAERMRAAEDAAARLTLFPEMDVAA